MNARQRRVRRRRADGWHREVMERTKDRPLLILESHDIRDEAVDDFVTAFREAVAGATSDFRLMTVDQASAERAEAVAVLTADDKGI